MLSYCSYRIGAGLKELYNFPEVQMFLNCLQPKEIYKKNAFINLDVYARYMPKLTGAVCA